MSIYEYLLSTAQKKGAGHLVLVDPDKQTEKQLAALVEQATEAGVDAFLIGGSLVMADVFEVCVGVMKKYTKKPVIIFPGSLHQLSKHADAILFLSIISGRNPDYLIGSQVLASPIIRKMNLEAISTAYLLIESGRTTSAEFMSNTRPLPRTKPDIAVAHILAAEYLGFKLAYLEAGSGAEMSVPDEMIATISQYCTMPLIVGGGLRTPEEAHQKVKAGAKFIVTGTAFEKDNSTNLIREFTSAIHRRKEG